MNYSDKSQSVPGGMPSVQPTESLPATKACQKRPRNRVYKGQPAWKRDCKCGNCPTCQDNARWEEGYAKFADPDYYARGLQMVHSSPLADG
jgi:hypothetical protein